MQRKTRDKMVEASSTSTNGYYARDLLTLVGPLEDLKVPRVQEGDFHPKNPPLPEESLPRAFGDHPYPFRCGSKHQEDFPLLRRHLQGFSLIPNKASFSSSKLLQNK